MRVVSDEERLLCLEAGAWFDDPNCTLPHVKSVEELEADIKATQEAIESLKVKQEEKADERQDENKKSGRPSKTASRAS